MSEGDYRAHSCLVWVVAALITGDEEVLHTSCRRPSSVRSKSLNSNVIEFHARITSGTCGVDGESSH